MFKTYPKASLIILLSIAVSFNGCQFFPNHYLIHTEVVPPQVTTWAEDHYRGKLLIHLEWAKPPGDGPFPTVMVHPEGGKTARQMLGVIWDLAAQGYAAVAVDYKRLIDGDYERNTFPWRSDADVTRSLDVISAKEWVDKKHIGVLGFSQGAVFSLLIAAHAPERIRAVVAYYPVTDFNAWFDEKRGNLITRMVFGVIRWHFYRESGAQSEEQFREMLSKASPMYYAPSIEAPVLLIHGDKDTSVSVEESERLEQRLEQLHKTAELVVIPGGVHIFNFRQPELAKQAWQDTLEWFRKYL
jgi:dipeptidyl aminopeptidase/acylaminoacyl peptidase